MFERSVLMIKTSRQAAYLEQRELVSAEMEYISSGGNIFSQLNISDCIEMSGS